MKGFTGRMLPLRKIVLAKTFIVLVIAMLLSACVLPKRVGGFVISGIVVDESTGEAIAGAEVRAYFSVSDAYGMSQNPLAGESITDDNGQFRIDAQQRTVVGGIGGWSGRVSKWPHIIFHRSGYCAQGMYFGVQEDVSKRPPIGKFEGLRVEMEKKHESCYETFIPERG